MSDLKLVAPDQPTALERQLLNAAANESPSAEQRLRVRLALGLPAVPPPFTPPPVRQFSGRALALKTAAGGLIAVSAALLWFTTRGRTPELRPGLGAAFVAVPSATVPATQANAASEAVPQPAPLVAPAATARAEEAKPAMKRTARPIASDIASESGEDLSEQLRLIDAARAAVAARNAQAAAAAISGYTSRFPRGAFGQEAAVLRIETLDLQGNHTQAATLARSFLARNPNSPHVSVVQRIAGAP